jgi:hypothetical protein
MSALVFSSVTYKLEYYPAQNSRPAFCLPVKENMSHLRLFQNLKFWNSNLEKRSFEGFSPALA